MHTYEFYRHILAQYIVDREIKKIYKAFDFHTTNLQIRKELKSILASMKKDILVNWNGTKKPIYQKAINQISELKNRTQIRKINL